MLSGEATGAPGGRAAGAPTFAVTGVRVHAVQIPGVVARMSEWIDRRDRGRCVAVTGMHGVSEARRDPRFRQALAEADLVVPDGMPLVWVGRYRGHPLKRRVYGPELMLEFCRATANRGYRHFFYGGAPGVANDLAAKLARRYPGVVIAGTWTPPYRPLSEDEAREVRDAINRCRPDILWVGLSTPRQELWMAGERARLLVPVMAGVGAAFDLNTGRVRQAPPWMREHGLEWSWRLAQEPRRLWRRYLLNGPRFALDVAMDLSGLRRFD